MPRKQQPPRLALRKEGSRQVWIIRHMQTYVRTGFDEANYDQAEAALRGYLDGSFKPQSIGDAIGIGCIYYASAAGSDTYPVKIGYSSGAARCRIEDLQIGNPNVLVCLATERGTWRIERERHQRFRAFHIRGEWYGRSADLMSHIASLPGNETVEFDAEAHLRSQRLNYERAQDNENIARIESAQNETNSSEAA